MNRRPRGFWGFVVLVVVAAGSAARAATITVDSTADDFDLGPNGNCTLREAILAANTNAPVDACPAGGAGPGVTDHVVVPAGTYLLAIAGSGEDAGETGDLDLTDKVSIDGSGARGTVVDADGLDRVFEVHGGVVGAILDLGIRGGDAGGAGGGVLNGGTLTIQRCAISGNSSSGPGGGVRNDADLFVLESTISGNTTADHGGGVDDHGQSQFSNVTVVGNSVTGGGAGGGLYNLGGTAMAVRGATIAGNSASAGGALHVGGTVTLDHVVVVGGCDAAVAASNGGSLESPGDTCGFDAASDQTGVADAMLAPLGDHGGPTDTRAPLAGSPVIDVGANGLCNAIDQRGLPRPLDGDGDGAADCDAGAVEAEDAAGVFADGFESGDTGAWSVTVP